MHSLHTVGGGAYDAPKAFPRRKALERKKIMKKSHKIAAYSIWAILYCVCAGLGFMPDSQVQGTFKTMLTVLSFVFFLPPFLLAWFAARQDDGKTLKELRIISLTALGLSLFFIILIFISAANFGVTMRKVVSVLYLIFTAPLQCSQNWILPLFMWGCLLMGTLRRHQ